MFRLPRVTRLAATLFALLLLLNLGLASAFAAPPTMTNDMDNTALEKALKNRTEDVREVEKRLAQALVYDAQVDAVIAGLKGKGYDTQCLDTCEANMEHQLRHIEVQLAKANGLIATHPGFDARGRVIDQAAARATIASLNGLRNEIWAYGGDIYANMHNTFKDYGRLVPDAPFVEPTRPTQRSLIS